MEEDKIGNGVFQMEGLFVQFDLSNLEIFSSIRKSLLRSILKNVARFFLLGLNLGFSLNLVLN